jgi:two-component sensor histidine kinase
MKYLHTLIISTLLLSKVFSQSFSSDEQYQIDSFNVIITTSTSHDTSLAKAYLGLSEILYTSNLDTVIPLCEKTIDIAERVLLENPSTSIKKNLLTSLSGALNNVGYVFKIQGNTIKALEFYNRSLIVDQELDNKEGIATSLNNIGVIYDIRSDIPKALEYYLKSLKIKEELGNKRGISNTSINIGQLYEQQGDFIKAFDFYDKSLKINTELNDKRGIAQSLNNLGSIYCLQQNFSKGTAYYQRSLELKKELGDDIGVATALNNLGHIYDQQNNLSIALEYYLKSLKIKEEILNKDGVSFALLNVGSVLLKQGKIEASEGYLLRSLNLAQEVGAPELIRNAAELLSKLYEKQNQHAKALNMHKLFIIMRDSATNINTQKAIIEQSMQYDFDKKEALAKLEHEKELAIKDVEKKRQNFIIWAISIGLILILIFAVIIIKRLKVTRLQKEIIEQKNKENELLLGEIHHRVKNNLQVISSLLSLQERSIDDVSAKAAILEGKERVKSMGLIHKMLYQNDNYAGVEMDDYAQQLISSLLDSFGMNDSKIKLDISFSKLKLDVDTAIPVGLIINELVINSLKYAYDKTSTPQLKVNLTETSAELLLEVADNGSGSANALINSTSFGMKLIKSLSRQLGGSLSITDNEGINIKINITDYKLV